MIDIQFDEPGLDYARKYANRKPTYSTITALLIKAGFAKDEKQANIVMIIITILAAFIGYMFWPSSNQVVDTSAPQSAEVIMQ